MDFLIYLIHGPVVCKHVNLVPWHAPVARGPHGPLITAKCLEEKGGDWKIHKNDHGLGRGGDTERGPEGV